MTTKVSFSDWVDWLAFETMFVELYESATAAGKRDMVQTARRLSGGLAESDLAAFTSRVPRFDRTLNSFPAEERNRFEDQFSGSVSALSRLLVGLYERASESAP